MIDKFPFFLELKPFFSNIEELNVHVLQPQLSLFRSRSLDSYTEQKHHYKSLKVNKDSKAILLFETLYPSFWLLGHAGFLGLISWQMFPECPFFVSV